MAGYGDLAGWRAYETARGNPAPAAANDGEASAALLRAQDHIRYAYVSRLAPGYDDTLEVIEPAVYVAATLELATPGFFSKTFTPSQQKVLTQAGDIKWTVVGDASKAGSASPTSTLIEAMFGPYVFDAALDYAVLVV